MGKAYVGVDIGGTNTVIGVFDDSMTLVLKNSIPTIKPHFPNKTNNPESFFDALTDEIHRLVRESGYEGCLAAVGMGVPGKVNPVQGIAVGASNLGWFDVPFAAEMERRLGVPVRIDNDVRIYTLGEAISGAGKGYKDIICVTLGTGIAAGMMIDGKLVRGSDYFAGEIGHDPVPGVTYLCNCGKVGCMETITSATGIARLAEEAVASGKDTALSQLNRKLTSYDVYQACMEGDRTAIDIFQYVGTVLGQRLTTIVCLLNPQVIIIGGGASSAGELLLKPIRDTIYDRYTFSWKPAVVEGDLGDTAGLIGAVHFAIT